MSEPPAQCDSIFSKVISSMKSVFSNAKVSKKRFKRRIPKYEIKEFDLGNENIETNDLLNGRVLESASIELKDKQSEQISVRGDDVSNIKPGVEDETAHKIVNLKKNDHENSSSSHKDVCFKASPEQANTSKLVKNKREKKEKQKKNNVFNEAEFKNKGKGFELNHIQTNGTNSTSDKQSKDLLGNTDACADLSSTSNSKFLTVNDPNEAISKPRIVLKFRSEKTGVKSSNLKIVCETEKPICTSGNISEDKSKTDSHVYNKQVTKKALVKSKPEKILDRRSLRRDMFISRHYSGSKNKYATEDVNQKRIEVVRNDSHKDKLKNTVTRSTRRLSKEYSENILANAIARKQQSFNEGSNAPTKRRIKPTAKVLANKELRLGLETQNNARLGLSLELNEDPVQIRRSARQKYSTRPLEAENSNSPGKNSTKSASKTKIPKEKTVPYKNKQSCEINKIASPKKDCTSSVVSTRSIENLPKSERKPNNFKNDYLKAKNNSLTSEEREIRRLNKLKRKHLSKLGLRAVVSERKESFSINEHYTDESTMDSTATEVIIEYMNTQKKNLDYEREMRDRLTIIQNVDDAIMEDVNTVDISKSSSIHSIRSEVRVDFLSNRLRQTRKRLHSADNKGAAVNNEICMSPITGETAEDRALTPEESARIVIGCLCTETSNLYVAPRMLEEPVYCKAVDHIDSLRIGCCHLASKENNVSSVDYSPLVRPSPRAPFFLACDLHRSRLAMHHCCPGCGLFCTQGVFYRCSRNHFFHIQCALPRLLVSGIDVDTPMDIPGDSVGCPHCGVDRISMQNLNSQVWKVSIEMNCTGRTIVVPYQRMDFSPAYMSFRPPKNDTQGLSTQINMNIFLKRSHDSDQPIIPASLLPTMPIDFEALRAGRMKMIDYDDVLIGAMNVENPQEDLFSAIVNKENHTNVADRVLAALALNANPHKKIVTMENGTYLHLAAREFNLAAVHILKCVNCDLNAIDNQSRTPLMAAILNYDGELFMSADRGKRTLLKSVKMAVIKYLIKAGSNVLQKGPDGLTALHLAGKCGNLQACELLLDALPISSINSFLNMQDEGGWTPLVWAAENKHTEVVKFLLSRGADLSISDTERNTALHWAALAGCASTLETILSAPKCTSEDVNCPNVHGDTPLHVSARHDYYSCVVVLLARGARMDLLNTSNETPLDASPDENGETYRAMSLNSQLSVLTDGRKWNKPNIISNDISNGREPYPVSCVNEVDDVVLPKNFFYVSENCYEKAISIDSRISSMQGCTCKSGNCSDESCSCVDLSMKCWYDEEGRLVKDFDFADPPIVFECNGTCGCNRLTCQNTVVGKRRGISVFTRVQVFRLEPTSNSSSQSDSLSLKGWGLRAMTPIPSGSPVALYCGEVLTCPDADQRTNDDYVFMLDIKEGYTQEGDPSLCIDAALRGSAARFINHGCSSNLSPVKVYSWHRDLRLPDVVFFATRDIAAGEELTFDYGEKFWSVKLKQFYCSCGSEFCRYRPKDE